MTLDTTTINRLKEKLLADKARLEEELQRIAKPAGTAGGYTTQFEDIGTDPDENATEVEGYVGNIAIEGTLETELREIDDALGKITSGTYGVCEKTGKAIPIERLEVYPAARTLVDA